MSQGGKISWQLQIGAKQSHQHINTTRYRHLLALFQWHFELFHLDGLLLLLLVPAIAPRLAASLGDDILAPFKLWYILLKINNIMKSSYRPSAKAAKIPYRQMQLRYPSTAKQLERIQGSLCVQACHHCGDISANEDRPCQLQ